MAGRQSSVSGLLANIDGEIAAKQAILDLLHAGSTVESVQTQIDALVEMRDKVEHFAKGVSDGTPQVATRKRGRPRKVKPATAG